MSVYELLLNRRTIRRFQQKRIEWEILEKLVNVARLAPSGSNLQPLEFIVVDDPKMLPKVFETTRWAGYITPRGIPPEGERPVAYIVVLINSRIAKAGGQHDAAAAIMSMIAVACEEGIGSCWIGSIDRDSLRRILQIPEEYVIDAILALGYPNEAPVVEELTDSVKYWKDDQEVLHVPKRKLETILHRGRFVPHKEQITI
ncbi:nitroreductase [candidate division KSB1 bacterium]|nr:MAG: nitroreductase [candidate division KSB1 bacterium]